MGLKISRAAHASAIRWGGGRKPGAYIISRAELTNWASCRSLTNRRLPAQKIAGKALNFVILPEVQDRGLFFPAAWECGMTDLVLVTCAQGATREIKWEQFRNSVDLSETVGIAAFL